jgi:cAMP phosphodiesterase
MKVILVPTSVSGGRRRKQYATTCLINSTLALDAGAIGLYGSLKRQQRIKHLLLTHSHLDHVATLPMFLDNVYDGSGNCVTVYGHPATLESLKSDLFNNRLFPDFLKISTIRPPYLKLQEIQPHQTLELDGVRVTPVPVNHVVPTLGYIFQDENATVVHAGDTATTDEIWQRARSLPNLKAAFLEVTFPNSLAWLADIAKHLTPELYAAEMKKLPEGVRFVAVHLHPKYRREVVRELKALNNPHIEIGRFGVAYTF